MKPSLTPPTPALKTPQWAVSWRDSLVAFLFGRIFYSLIGFLIWRTGIRPPEADQFYYRIAPVLEGPAGALLGMWQRWDGIHYQSIATYGYADAHQTAFFPLYPLLGRGISWLSGLDSLPALIIVSNLALLASLVLLHHTVWGWFNLPTARASLIHLVIFPTSFFFYAVYPQSLLLLFVLLALWLALSGRWWFAGIAALLSGLTHGSAIVLSVPLAYIAWERHLRVIGKDWRSLPRLSASLSMLLATTAPALGMGLFMLWTRLAGLPVFIETHSQGWSRRFHWPWQAAVDFTVELVSTPFELSYIAMWINIGIFFLTIALTVFSMRRIPRPAWLLQLSTLLLLLVHYLDWNPFHSFFRIILTAFPLYITLALLGSRKTLRLSIAAISLVLALILSTLFFLWQGGLT